MKKKKKESKPLNKEELQKQLKRKSSALERFKRESKIEAALESVRSRALAMHKSDELSDVVTVVFEKLQELDFSIDGAAFISTYIANTRESNIWIGDNHGQAYKSSFRQPYYDSPQITDIWTAMEQGLDFQSKVYPFEEKNKCFRYVFEHTDMKILADELKEWILLQPCLTQVFAMAKNSMIGIHYHYEKKLTANEKDILKRFSKVFDQAYIRFLDLQKAEALARESQIELGLEKVRARAMAMQKSDELSELVDIVFKELTKLDFALTWCIINIIDESSMSNTVWAANPDITKAPESYHMLFEDYPFHHAMMKAWKQRSTKSVYTLEGNEKKIYDEYLFSETEFRRTPEAAQAASRAMEKYVVSFSFSNFGGLQTVGDVPLSDANLDILSRFGKVFDLTYTRFNDLKKAEAQTRESQIQLALERVRARTMAMQKSTELSETASLLFRQARDLGIQLWSNAFQIWNADDISTTAWASAPDGSIQAPFRLPYNEDIFFKRIYEARQTGKDFFVMESSGQELEETYHYMFNLPGVKKYFDDAQNLGFSIPKYQVTHCAFFAQGYLMFITYEPVPDAHDIFKRFGVVFEQTYTRFLDLQKAEAQARESQIQLALERVRARTMAMQRSDELIDAASVLFKQLKELGVDSWSSGFNLWQPDGRAAIINMCNPDGSIGTPYHLPHTEDIFFVRICEARQRGDDLLVMETGGKELEDTYNYMLSLPHVAKMFSDMVSTGVPLPKFQVNHCAFFAQGYLMFITYEPVPEMWDVFKRFAKVFEQTYTRFLDLQNAEAQARESQIQLALERVRARTMAMQHSSELPETATLLFQQVKELGFDSWATAFCLWTPDDDLLEVWSSAGEGTLLPLMTLPHKQDPTHLRIFEAHLRGDTFYEEENGGEALAKHYEWMMSIPSVKMAFSILGDSGHEPPTRQYYSVAFFKQGYLLILTKEPKADASDLSKRFAKVFEQTYTRFLDLQKAELQAREAQIQLALERIRARTMAMQHSDELKNAAALLFQQVKSLGAPAYSCGYNIWEKGDKEFTSWMSVQDGSEINGVPNISLTEDANFIRYVESKQNGEQFFVLELRGERMQEHYEYLKTIPAFKGYFDYAISVGFDLPETQIHHLANFSNGNLLFITLEPCPEFHDVFRRFAAVFEQTYTRFLDLQKAEEQAREAKVEASLERVRASAMAMHHSDELSDVLSILFEQFDVLGIRPVDAHLDLFDWEKNTFTYRATGKEGKRVIAEQIVDLDSREEWKALAEKWKRSKPNAIDFSYYPKEVIRELMAFFPDIWAAMPEEAIMSPEDFPDGMYDTLGYCKFGYIGFHHYRKATEEEKVVLIRFANEFERLYQRFLDLQKAEAQARESHIQLALERVRARTMAMQKSDELPQAANLLFQQVQSLGMPAWSAGYCIWDDDKKAITLSMSSEGVLQPTLRMPLTEDPSLMHFVEAHQRGETFFVEEVGGEALKSHYAYLRTLPGVKETLDDIEKAGFPVPTFQIFHCAYFSKGFLLFITYEPVPEAHDIFKRFGKVFDQTYTRFLDLQKAEAQARESQIELALERVRARTMAMQKSDELPETSFLLFQQVKELGETASQFSIGIIKEETGNVELSTTIHGHHLPRTLNIPINDPYVMAKAVAAWKANRQSLKVEMEGPELKGYNEWRNTILGTKMNFLEEQWIINLIFFSKGWLSFSSDKNISGETFGLLKRFAAVFEQTYTRFNDLKQAEEQARESQIEAALERVRSRSMGMQKSEELKEVIQVVYEQFVHLNINVEHTGFVMDYKARDDYDIWIADPLGVPSHVTIPYFDCVYYNRFNEAKKKGEDFFASNLDFEEKNRFYKKIIEYIPGLPEETKEFLFRIPGLAGSTVLLDNVCLYIENFSGTPYSEEENNTLMRFGKVFQQTYTRFLDLQKAEAQAREAIRRASVDRVRAEIASMRTTNDLERITPLVWNELTTLGVPFIRCGVFIMDEEREEVQSYLSTPDGEAIAAFRQPYNSPGETAQIIDHWHKKQMYKQHWNEAQFIEFTKNLVEQGAIVSGEKYLTENRPADLYLHFVPFFQGMLYAGNTRALSDDELQLVQNLADAFSTAYARYEDFNKLEVAKEQIEITLVDLKQAQSQLVQSEKMASLGELTAGIAHEIQNPLNFVNNFSDVNKELLTEMNEAIEKGNFEEVKDILKDFIGNEEKIGQHGRRADAIVKSMLQHSRISAGQKQSTDINALADEYLRLSYHGLRAKNQSFNTEMQTHFDPAMGKIDIIPQDVGRVLLNLFNNAFYAVSQRASASAKATADKSAHSNGSYKPLVTVTTRRTDNKIEICLRDNGNGIPEKIKDKIFQPFFTTKPTGQGTGLGLSLSYDIIKAHGGDIKVESKEGEGSEFVVQLPV